MNPLKQGLKQLKTRVIIEMFIVRIVNPLKQGLKRETKKGVHRLHEKKVRIVNPLKQGLKLNKKIFILTNFSICKNSESIKTRIETFDTVRIGYYCVK